MSPPCRVLIFQKLPYPCVRVRVRATLFLLLSWNAKMMLKTFSAILILSYSTLSRIRKIFASSVKYRFNHKWRKWWQKLCLICKVVHRKKIYLKNYKAVSWCLHSTVFLSWPCFGQEFKLSKVTGQGLIVVWVLLTYAISKLF